MPESTASSEPKPSVPVGRRLGSIALLLLLLAGLAAGGVGGWSWWNRRDVPLAVGTDFTPDPAPFFGRLANRAAQQADGVTVSPGRVVVARAGTTTLNIVGRAGNVWRMTVARRGNGPRPAPADLELIRLQERLVEIRTLPAGVTEAHRSTLAALGTQPPELDAAQANRVGELCQVLTTKPATDPAVAPAKAELLAIAQAIAKADANAVVAAYKARADQVRAALPPQVLQRLLAPPARPANNPAATVPATTRPANPQRQQAVATRPAAPNRPANATRPANANRPQNENRQQNENRPQNEVRQQNANRQQNADANRPQVNAARPPAANPARPPASRPTP